MKNELLVNDFLINFDKDANQLTINSESQKPLTIILKCPVQILLETDTQIESNGQLDITSYKQPICIDTISSKLFINSRRSKKMRNVLDVKDISDVNYSLYEDISYLKIKILELENIIRKEKKGL